MEDLYKLTTSETSQKTLTYELQNTFTHRTVLECQSNQINYVKVAESWYTDGKDITVKNNLLGNDMVNITHESPCYIHLHNDLTGLLEMRTQTHGSS